MAKAWLRDRWEMLFPLLEGLTIEDEDEIAQICLEEIEAWRARPTMRSHASLKEPLNETRKEMARRLPRTEATSWLNPRTGEREPLALRYMNYSQEEWAAMNAPSEAKFEERKVDRKFIDRPDLVVQRARELIQSKSWEQIAVGLAVLTGRRLTELLKVGKLTPKTDYTVIFSGQLKRKDEVLNPYEIPTLVEADLVLSAWRRLRELVDCSNIEKKEVSRKYGPAVVAMAQRKFVDLVPAREGADLYTHLFRAVYGRIATHYYAEPRISDLEYMAEIYGHYWITNAEGEKRRNYASTMHYADYLIGDGHGNIDGRQGIHLGQPGVKLLEVLVKLLSELEKSKSESGKSEKEKPVSLLPTAKKKEHSLTRIEQETKVRIDVLQDELGCGSQDVAVSTAIDSHYELQQIVELLKPLYEQFGVDNPVSAVRALTGEGSALLVDQRLGECWQTTLAEVENLFEEASDHAVGDNPYQAEYDRALAAVEGKPDGKITPLQEMLQGFLKLKNGAYGRSMPVLYIKSLLDAKSHFLKSYENRGGGKDYSKVSTAELRNTKTAGAAQERFRRAVDAIIQYNDQATVAEVRWFINPAVVVDLVGGRPADIKAYLDTRREEIAAHHQKYDLSVGYNRRPISIAKRVIIADPQGSSETVSPSDSLPEDREVPAEESSTTEGDERSL